MSNPKVEEFAALLVKHVRDRAIRTCDARLSQASTSKASQRWQVLHNQGVDIPSFIPDVVDTTLGTLLASIDEGLLEFEWEDANGARVDLTEAGEGEMCGWYLGVESWRASYANERYVEYSDLPSILDVPDLAAAEATGARADREES